MIIIQRNSKPVVKGKLKDQLTRKTQEKKEKKEGGWTPKDKMLWLHTGSVIMNIKCSGGNPDGGYKEGKIESVIGDSDAGKTVLVMTGLAHATNEPVFDDYRIIFDDAEEADSFDHKKLFGKKFADRLEPPGYDKKGEPQNSETVEMFSDHIHDACDEAEKEGGKPFIYVLDSLDAIDSDKEIQRELDNRDARKKENLSKIKDSYGGSKQKYMSKFFRQTRTRLKNTHSFLIIICQTRDNLVARSFVKQRVAGGRARKFYSSIESWLAHIKPITKTIAGIKYPIGVETRIKIAKNNFIGKNGELNLSIYPSYGVDDISSCIDYLVECGHWKQPKGSTKIKAKEFGLDATSLKIVEFIEKKEGRDRKLFNLCSKVYLGIEDRLALVRKPKFRF